MTDSQVLLITGASSGIGAATAHAAVAAGYRVALAARRIDRLEAMVAELGADHAHAVACDVTDFGQQERAVAATIERFGRLDAALANAGFGAKRGFLEESPEHWRDMVETNVTGCAFTIRAALLRAPSRSTSTRVSLVTARSMDAARLAALSSDSGSRTMRPCRCRARARNDCSTSFASA